MISDAVIETVRSRVDIHQVIGAVVQLKRAGSTFKGLCPFHSEKTPSFHVDPQRQSFKCFGCHEGGDAIKFIQLTERLNFPEAVRRLAKQVGVEIPDERPLSPRRKYERKVRKELKERLFDTQRALCDWYQLTLTRSTTAQN